MLVLASCRSNGDLPGFSGDFSCQPNTDDNFSGHYKTEISHAFHRLGRSGAINADIRVSFYVSFALHP